MPQPGDDFTSSDGYNKPSNDLKPAILPVVFDVAGGQVSTVYPASSAIGTITEVTTVRLDKGWNAWARSIDPLEAGNFFQATLPVGIEAAFFALAPKGYDGRHISSFSHGVMINVGGITVREKGTHKAGLNSSYTLSSKVKIFRDESGVIYYVVTTGTETKFYKSPLVRQENQAFPLYIYGYLYSGGDRVETNEFIAGRVQEASV